MNRPDQHDPGFRSLLNAMCLQAMYDYFILYRMGAVKELAPTGYFKRKIGMKLPSGGRSTGGLSYQNLSPSDIPDLIRFLTKDMSRLLTIMGHHASPIMLRERILHLERTGEWRELFGQGVGVHQARERAVPLPTEKGDAPSDAPLDLLLE